MAKVASTYAKTPDYMVELQLSNVTGHASKSSMRSHVSVFTLTYLMAWGRAVNNILMYLWQSVFMIVTHYGF